MMNKRSLMMVNIAAMAAMFVAVINLITLKEAWVLVAAIAVMAGLTLYAVNEKFKMKKAN
jgi:hypothetical protein